MAQRKLVFVDVDTQVDFMLPSGNLYVPGAEEIIPNLKRLRDFAKSHRVPVISSVDAHTHHDEEFQQFPPHCVKGTSGQQKLPQTLLPQPEVLPNEKRSLPPDEELFRVRQWIVEKQKFDLFTNVNADWLFEKLTAEQYAVYGVATEYCVKAAVLALLRRGQRVSLVTDAIREIAPESSRSALREMQAAGAKLIETQQVLAMPMAA